MLAGDIYIQSTETTKSIFQINKIVAKFLIVLVAVSVLFLCSVYTPTNAAPNDAGTIINITSPSNYDKVQMDEIVKGTAINVPEGQTLWILVSDYYNYFPQNIAQIQENNEWRTQIRIGNQEHTSKEFEIYAVLANQIANSILASYYQNNISKPISNLPDGAKIYDYVTVKRDASLRERMIVILTKDSAVAAIIGAIGVIIGAIITAIGAIIVLTLQRKNEERRSTEKKSFKVTLDRIEKDIAVLLVSIHLLPPNSKEGDILDISITKR